MWLYVLIIQMTDCLLIPLNFVKKLKNYATVEKRKKWLQTIFPFSHPPLSPHSNSLSLAFIYATSQSIYLPNIVLFFPLFCFDCFLATVRIFVFCYCSLFVSFSLFVFPCFSFLLLLFLTQFLLVKWNCSSALHCAFFPTII